uniref:Uncharacterized protein n=1 Tax=Leptobrachium leishanense TaxID=445787 RepID=A0A8C5MND5_9ANUR
MNIAVACLVFFLALTQALPGEMEFNEDRYWPESNQNQADLQSDIDDPVLERYLLRIARKARPAQVYEIFAKRSNDLKRLSPERQKNFVGLMGKRSLSSESEERDVKLDFNRRRK